MTRCGQNGNRGHLGAGAGGGWHLDQRQSRTPRQTDPVNGGQCLGCAHQQRHQFGAVQGTAPTETDNAINAGRARGPDRRFHHVLRRVGLYLGKHRHLNLGVGQGGQGTGNHSGLHQARVSHQKDVRHTQSDRKFAEPIGATLFTQDSGRCFKRKL